MSSASVATLHCDIVQALSVVFRQLGIAPTVLTNSIASCRAFHNLSVEFDLSMSKLSVAQVSSIAKNHTVVGVSLSQADESELRYI